MSPWQLLAEMGDNHWSGQKGIKSSLLSAYCVGNLLCYEEQCADVFSVSISFTVWAAACRTSLLLHGNPTRKETHQAHFVWLISYPQATNAVPPTHQTSLINFWCDLPISVFAQRLLSFLSPELHSAKLHSCHNLIGSKIKVGTENGTRWKRDSSRNALPLIPSL